MAETTPEVVGGSELVAKQSAVDGCGDLKVPLIEGMQVRETRPVPHEDGHVTEIARADWGILSQPVVQVHMTTTMAGRVRAWGLHQKSTDRLFVVNGLVRIVLFDGRLHSPTRGRFTELTLSEKNPALVTVPPDVYHGWKNIGTTEAIVINMPTRVYQYDEPDALDLPWDSDLAAELIPYRW
ncbi:MAG: dTDP-4-dehydrorhamnose 3,5-epimerase family protein [Acidimicrobiales bacterium]